MESEDRKGVSRILRAIPCLEDTDMFLSRKGLPETVEDTSNFEAIWRDA